MLVLMVGLHPWSASGSSPSRSWKRGWGVAMPSWRAPHGDRPDTRPPETGDDADQDGGGTDDRYLGGMTTLAAPDSMRFLSCQML